MALYLTKSVTENNPVAGDLYLDAGRSLVVVAEDSEEAIEQRWAARLRLLKTEWFVDENLGTPWLGDDGLLTRKATRATQALIDDRVRRITQETTGIKTVLELSCVLTGRRWQIDVRVRLANGSTKALSTTV